MFAIADDASWKHFGAYGCRWVKTPAFDRIAKDGILFTRAYTVNAKSAPSRACILTGRNSWQLEEACNHFPHFPAKFKTYVEALGEQGYWVGSTGKGWAPGDPGKIKDKERQLAGPKFDRFTTMPPTTGISSVDYAKNFEAFLEGRPENRPFCFWYGSHEPHRSYEFGSAIKQGGKNMWEVDAIPTFWPDVDSIRTDMLDYAFEIEYFDSHLQKMLKKLEEIGELENTIIIVTSDNGMPFPRIKGQVYEYSNHMPLAIMWPKGIKKPGRIVDQLVGFIDFVPTFLELAGLNANEVGMQEIAGRSLTEFFYSEKKGVAILERNYLLIGKERHDVGRPDDEGYPVRGIIRKPYLYLRNFKPERWPAGNPETGYLNCDGSPTKTYLLDTRRKKGIWNYWHLNFGKRPDEELYNIDLDPFCMHNLAYTETYRGIRLELVKEMERRLREQQDPRMVGKGDVFDRYEYAGEVKNYYNRYMNGERVRANWVNESDYDSDLMGK